MSVRFVAAVWLGLGLGCAERPELRAASSAGPETAANAGPASELSAGPVPAAPASQPQPQPQLSERSAGQRAVPVPGFEPALLFTPGGSEARPLVVATHGAGGGPEWECDYWRRLTRERAFVLCLRGTPLGSYSGFYYRDHRALERELVAAVAVARSAEPSILPGSGIYAGFSQGSTMGTLMISAHAQELPYLVLIDGFQLWNIPAARAFARAGGKRVVIACGSKECAKIGKESARWLESSGVEARFSYARGAGHTPAGAVERDVAAALPWLLAGDRVWAGAFD